MKRWHWIGAVAAALAAAAGAGAVGVPPPVDQIAYLGGGKALVINSDGTGETTLLASGQKLRVDNWGGIAWSPDGAQIAFTVGDHTQGRLYGDTLRIYLANADGSDPKPLPGAAAGSFGPTWSPDGKEIAYASHGAADSGIAVVGVDGSNPKMIASSTGTGQHYWNADWSPEGTSIVFDSYRSTGGRTTLMEVDPDGAALHQIGVFDTGNHCVCADWSPDGSKFVYQATTSPKDDYPEIYVMNADGTHRVRLTRNRVRDEDPDWSPDGSRIAFTSERRGNAEIYVVAATGGQAQRLTRDPWYSDEAAWRPSS